MELIIILVFILVCIVIGLLKDGPSECYECGARFKEVEVRWYNEDDRNLCYSYYLKETGGEI